jgi:hypothetical protein
MRLNSTGIAQSVYGLDDRMIGVRVPAEAVNFSLQHRVQTGCGAHPASYTVGIGSSFPGGKASGGVKLTTHLHLVPRSKNASIYTSTPQYAFMTCCLFEAQGQLYFIMHLNA